MKVDFDIVFDDYFADELEEIAQFAQDGLVSVEKQGRELLVTGTGRLLIRRICMTFDAYIPKANGHSGILPNYLTGNTVMPWVNHYSGQQLQETDLTKQLLFAALCDKSNVL